MDHKNIAFKFVKLFWNVQIAKIWIFGLKYFVQFVSESFLIFHDFLSWKEFVYKGLSLLLLYFQLFYEPVLNNSHGSQQKSKAKTILVKIQLSRLFFSVQFIPGLFDKMTQIWKVERKYNSLRLINLQWRRCLLFTLFGFLLGIGQGQSNVDEIIFNIWLIYLIKLLHKL